MVTIVIITVFFSGERCSINVGSMELDAASDRERSALVGLSEKSPRFVKSTRSRVRLSTEPCR